MRPPDSTAQGLTQLERHLRDLMLQTGCAYGAVVSADGRSHFTAGTLPCAPERLIALALAMVHGAGHLLESGRVERASLQLEQGGLYLFQIDPTHYRLAFARGPAPVLRRMQLERAVAKLRGEERRADDGEGLDWTW